jgi:hypothetical protein
MNNKLLKIAKYLASQGFYKEAEEMEEAAERWPGWEEEASGSVVSFKPTEKTKDWPYTPPSIHYPISPEQEYYRESLARGQEIITCPHCRKGVAVPKGWSGRRPTSS